MFIICMRARVQNLFLLCGLFLFLEIAVHAVGVGPSGYTNDFNLQPSEIDWATWSRPGAQGDVYDLDADVNTVITAGGVTNQTALRANNPPGVLGPATWSSIGFYLQTRPLTNRYTALMAKFVNNTGSNATQITVSYLLTIAGGVAVEDLDKGTRVYYSLSGETNSWVNIPALNTVASNGTYNLNAAISLNWPIGGNLFLLWADDNAIPTTDVANQLDNFSLRLTAATPPAVILAPPDGTSLVFGEPLVLTATLNAGVPPHTVTFYTNGQPAGSLSSTYSTNLGVLPVGSYTCYVHATDSALPPLQANSSTNVITILPNPLSVTLTSPSDGQSVTAGQPLPVTATAAVNAPVTINAVEFFLDGTSVGVDNTVPYSVSVSPALGNHTVHAVASDSVGRIAYSVTNSITAIPPANAAVVGPGGYTNNFTTRPPATDWATFSRIGTAADAYDMDGEVSAVITADGVNIQVLNITEGNPPGANQLAVWSQLGQYLQTRPTGNRFTALMGKFLNNTGTNATEINISYLYAVLAGANEEAGRGTRVYYSLTGAGDWVNLPALNTITVNTGQTRKSTNVVLNWPHESALYLLWADDNANAFGTDAPHQIDDFFLGVAAGSPTALLPEVSLTAPTNNASFFAPASITLSATATDTDGTVTNVEFFVDGVKLGEDAASPYTINWNNPPLGPHVLHAVATDSQGASGRSTNVFITVYDAAGRPFAQITSPTNGTSVEGPTNLTVTANAFAPSGVTNVEFYAGTGFIGSSTGAALDNARADYQFQNTLASSEGTVPVLANLGPNTFTTANVDGQSRTVLRFAQNDGLALSQLSSVVPTNVYSIVILFSFDVVSNWRRLLEFKNGASDYGLYVFESSLDFYPAMTGPADTIPAGAVVQVALTRDSAGNVAGYVDGIQQFSFVDSTEYATIDANNVLRFFRDNGTEGSPGFVARIRLYDVALSPSQIASLDRLPGVGSYRISWNAPFGTHALTAVAADANGVRGTSAVHHHSAHEHRRAGHRHTEPSRGHHCHLLEFNTGDVQRAGDRRRCERLAREWRSGIVPDRQHFQLHVFLCGAALRHRFDQLGDKPWHHGHRLSIEPRVQCDCARRNVDLQLR
jgi:hypothetical protein